ncbi:MAG: metallophosphoesterase [Clostridiales bacterium]|nr:metallophosphoesterase [Clostridiales bacterium]
MKKLIILSDTHGNAKAVEKLLPLIAENDYVLHLGDGSGDMRDVLSVYPEKVYLCGGNCDFFSSYPIEGELEIEYLKIFYCHGHKYGVKSDLEKLALEAKRRGCDIALYGHTHRASIDTLHGVTLINPGSLRFPLDKGGSYCYLVIHKDKAVPTIVGDRMYERELPCT